MLNELKRLLPRSWKRRLKRSGRNLIETLRYNALRPSLNWNGPQHIIFVCKGNICRSAFAEHYFQKRNAAAQHTVESCGIDVDQGVYSPTNAIKAAERFGVDLQSHRSKGFHHCDVENATLIIAMEFPQIIKLREKFPQKQDQIVLLQDFAPGTRGIFCNIYDPFGLDINAFDRCFDQVTFAVDGLIDRIHTGHRVS